MLRRDFLTLTGLGLGGLIVPPFFGRTIAAEELSSRLDVALKKRLADAALDAATEAGASYCDVRIGRYLQQFVITREDKVENVVNTESTGVGIRVLANGTWGFAATSDSPTQGVAGAARQAAAIAKANAKAQLSRCSWPRSAAWARCRGRRRSRRTRWRCRSRTRSTCCWASTPRR